MSYELIQPLEISRDDYELIRRLVYTHSGINLGDQKAPLVRARLGKIVREGGFSSFREYYQHVEQDSSGEGLRVLLDAISTNTTHLFREARHFDRLHRILQTWLADRSWRARHSCLRIWSAGCSTGEEPHSIAMVASDVLQQHPDVKLKILATDLSVRVLSRASVGIYKPEKATAVPPELRERCLRPVRTEDGEALQIAPELRKLITFARFNLMTPTYPFRNKFNVIFCRNVMIYFDQLTQQTVAGRMAEHLHEGGFLLIGHSESLNNVRHTLKYVEPTIYRK